MSKALYSQTRLVDPEGWTTVRWFPTNEVWVGKKINFRKKKYEASVVYAPPVPFDDSVQQK